MRCDITVRVTKKRLAGFKAHACAAKSAPEAVPQIMHALQGAALSSRRVCIRSNRLVSQLYVGRKTVGFKVVIKLVVRVFELLERKEKGEMKGKLINYGQSLAGVATILTLALGYTASALATPPGSVPGAALVNCNQATISNVLEKRPQDGLVIVVSGTCREDVIIERDGVTLVAENPGLDGIISQAPDGVAVTVAGARGIVIDGLHLQSEGGGSPTGVFVTRNGDATIQNAVIDNNTNGIQASHGGFVLVRDSEVVNNASYGILLTDGGRARVQDCTVEIDNNDTVNSAAIGAFRGITLRLRGNNEIRNLAAGGFSIDLVHSVDFRQDGGHTTFLGTVEFANLVNASLRDPEIVGGVRVFGNSRVDIRNSSTPDDEISGNGELSVGGTSQLMLSRSNMTANVASISVDQFSNLFLAQNVNLTSAGNMRINGSRFSMAPYASLTVNGGPILVEDFSIVFANNNTSIIVPAGMHFGGSVTKVNLFGTNVNFTGNLFFSPSSTLDFGPDAIINGSISCGGGDVFFQGGYTISGFLVDCQSFP